MTGPRVSRCWIALEGAADAAWIAEALALLGDAIADRGQEGGGGLSATRDAAQRVAGLWDGDVPMADEFGKCTAAEEWLGYLATQLCGVPDDKPLSPNCAGAAIEAALKEWRESRSEGRP